MNMMLGKRTPEVWMKNQIPPKVANVHFGEEFPFVSECSTTGLGLQRGDLLLESGFVFGGVLFEETCQIYLDA